MLFYTSHGENVFPQIKTNVIGITEIIKCSTYEIVVEGVVVCKAKDMLTAFETVLAMFYIFNLEYPKGLAATLTFFQKQIVGLNDQVAPITKVVNLIARLNKEQ